MLKINLSYGDVKECLICDLRIAYDAYVYDISTMKNFDTSNNFVYIGSSNIIFIEGIHCTCRETMYFYRYDNVETRKILRKLKIKNLECERG